MATRPITLIEADMEQIRGQASHAGRTLSEIERERLDDLIVERAAAIRESDASWRSDYVRQQRQFWKPLEHARLRAALRPSPVFLTVVGVAALSGFLLAASPSERAARPLTVLFVLSAWIVTVCLHEFGHAIAAWFGGDRSVIARGYLNLDPRRYTNPLLSIALPILFLLLGGFALPGGAVLIEDDQLRSRRWRLLVDAGGPLATLACLLVCATPFLIGIERFANEGNVYFWAALAALVKLLAVVLILNLLPIPPLDGFRIITHWLGDDVRRRGLALGWMPMMLFYMVMMRRSPLTDAFWNTADTIGAALRLPYGWAEYSLQLLSIFG